MDLKKLMIKIECLNLMVKVFTIEYCKVLKY